MTLKRRKICNWDDIILINCSKWLKFTWQLPIEKCIKLEHVIIGIVWIIYSSLFDNFLHTNRFRWGVYEIILMSSSKVNFWWIIKYWIGLNCSWGAIGKESFVLKLSNILQYFKYGKRKINVYIFVRFPRISQLDIVNDSRRGRVYEVVRKDLSISAEILWREIDSRRLNAELRKASA